MGIVAGVLQSGGRVYPSRHSSRGAGRSRVPCSFVSLIAPPAPCNVSTWTGVAEDEAVAIYDVEQGVVDGAGTRLGITGSGFTATEEGAGVNCGVPLRMLLATTR